MHTMYFWNKKLCKIFVFKPNLLSFYCWDLKNIKIYHILPVMYLLCGKLHFPSIFDMYTINKCPKICQNFVMTFQSHQAAQRGAAGSLLSAGYHLKILN